MKQVLLFFLCPFLLLAQTQIGDDFFGEAAEDRFGESISLSDNGNVLAISATVYDETQGNGYVQVFENQGGDWVQLGADISVENGQVQWNRAAPKVSLSEDGNVLAIGYYMDNDTGYSSTRIYNNQSGNWVQVGSDIQGDETNDYSGFTVNVSSTGNRVAIGAQFKDVDGMIHAGQVKIFENQSDNWVQIGNAIVGQTQSERVGRSISFSGDGNRIAIVGEGSAGLDDYYDDIRVYENQSGNWVQLGDAILTDDVSANPLALELSFDGHVMVVGSTGVDGNGVSAAGSVRVYEYLDNENWYQLGESFYGYASYDSFGGSVSINDSGDVIAIGSRLGDTNGENSGYAKIYKLNGEADWAYNCYPVYDPFGNYLYDDCFWEDMGRHWTQVGDDISGDVAGDFFGFAVSMSSMGDTVAISAIGNDSNGDFSGQVKVFDLTAALSIESFEQDFFTLYPNPVKEVLNLELNSGFELKQVNIYDALGKYLYSSRALQINVSNLSSGIYFLEVETNKGKSAKKIVVE